MFIDTHSHLNLEQFVDDFRFVFERMEASGVRTQTVGVDVESSQYALQLAQEFPHMTRAIVGIHPAYVEKDHNYDNDLLGIREIISDSLCVGIGECGFDFFRCDKSEIYDAQASVFRRQIDYAVESKKPLMLHLRPTKGTTDAYADALDMLSPYKGNVTGQAHFFAGTLAQAGQFLDMGFYISCTGVVTFTRDYDDLIRYVPVDRLLLETDAPYVAPTPFRGSRCEPQYVVEVYKRVALLKNMPIEELCTRMTDNVLGLYGW